MEYCEEGDLVDFVELRNKRKITYTKNDRRLFYSLAVDIARGLKAMHMHKPTKYIHRDIKPDNIFLTCINGKLTAKLGDFGWTRIVDENGVMTNTAGNKWFNAPEIETGKYDISADIFSFGVTLLYLFVGMYPFNFNNPCKTQKIFE